MATERSAEPEELPTEAPRLRAMNAVPRIALLLVCALVVAVGCTGAAVTPTPGSSPRPSAFPSSTPVPNPSPTPPASSPDAGKVRLDVALVAGPVCPVERNPPDPNCAARPVVRATIVIRDATGAQVAQLTSDAMGHATTDLAPGPYVVEAMSAAGLMGTPQPLSVQLTDAASGIVTLSYDTGIR
jgi:hypothetical protein